MAGIKSVRVAGLNRNLHLDEMLIVEREYPVAFEGVSEAHAMSFQKDLFESPVNFALPSRYIAINGITYFVTGLLMIAWPGLVQIILQDPPFVGHEEALFRVIGMLIAVVGWLYFFGSLSGSRQFIAATVVDRLTLVPAVLVFIALSGVFPHVSMFFAVFDPALAIGTLWITYHRVSPTQPGRTFKPRANG